MNDWRIKLTKYFSWRSQTELNGNKFEMDQNIFSAMLLREIRKITRKGYKIYVCGVKNDVSREIISCEKLLIKKLIIYFSFQTSGIATNQIGPIFESSGPHLLIY